MWALFLRWGLEVGGLSSPSCLCQGGLVCLILGPIERPVWLSRKAVFCSPNQPLAAPAVTCWPPPAAPLSYFLVGSELGWRRGKLFLGLVKDPLPFIQTLHTNHLLCAHHHSQVFCVFLRCLVLMGSKYCHLCLTDRETEVGPV